MTVVNIETQLAMKGFLKAIFTVIRYFDDDKSLISKEMYEILGDEKNRKKLLSLLNDNQNEIEEFNLKDNKLRVKVASDKDDVISNN